MTHLRNLFIVVLILAVSVVFVGCGEEEETVQFAMSGAYPPFNFYDDNNELVGFDVDISREAAERMGMEYEAVTTSWDGIIAGLNSGHYDGIWGSMAVTEERLERVDFSDPYYFSGAQLVVPEDSPYDSIEDLPEDARIGVVTGTTFEELAEEHGEVVHYEDDSITLNELDYGNVDAVITDRLVAIMTINDHDYDIRLAGDLLYTETMAVAIDQDNEELLDAINEALAEMIEDGTYEEINEKWFPGYNLLEE